MTGKQLSEDHRAILAKLLQIPKLNNHDIAFVLNVDERTVRRRRYEFEDTGQIKKHKDVSKNAEKLKPHHLEKLVEWHKDHPDALLDDMQLFLRTQCGLEVSVPTISRQMRKAYGGNFLRTGRCARIRSRQQREAEGRSIAGELQQSPGSDSPSNADQAAAQDLYHDLRRMTPLQQSAGDSPGIGDQAAAQQDLYHDQRQMAPAPLQQSPGDSPGVDDEAAAHQELYHDHRQMAPLQHIVNPHSEPQRPGQVPVVYHAAGEQQYQVDGFS